MFRKRSVIIATLVLGFSAKPVFAEDSPYFLKPSPSPSVTPTSPPDATPSPTPPVTSNPLRKDFHDRDDFYLKEVKLRP